jgi:hypothetical protein
MTNITKNMSKIIYENLADQISARRMENDEIEAAYKKKHGKPNNWRGQEHWFEWNKRNEDGTGGDTVEVYQDDLSSLTKPLPPEYDDVNNVNYINMKGEDKWKCSRCTHKPRHFLHLPRTSLLGGSHTKRKKRRRRTRRRTRRRARRRARRRTRRRRKKRRTKRRKRKVL